MPQGPDVAEGEGARGLERVSDDELRLARVVGIDVASSDRNLDLVPRNKLDLPAGELDDCLALLDEEALTVVVVDVRDRAPVRAIRLRTSRVLPVTSGTRTTSMVAPVRGFSNPSPTRSSGQP
jgi:hypothetical protein